MHIIMAANGLELEFQAWLRANGYTYSLMHGCYNGSIETSFKIELSYACNLFTFLSLAKDLKQECILVVKNDKARLIYTNSLDSKSIGIFKEVPKELALKSDNFSLDLETNKYYIAS